MFEHKFSMLEIRSRKYFNKDVQDKWKFQGAEKK